VDWILYCQVNWATRRGMLWIHLTNLQCFTTLPTLLQRNTGCWGDDHSFSSVLAQAKAIGEIKDSYHFDYLLHSGVLCCVCCTCTLVPERTVEWVTSQFLASSTSFVIYSRFIFKSTTFTRNIPDHGISCLDPGVTLWPFPAFFWHLQEPGNR